MVLLLKLIKITTKCGATNTSSCILSDLVLISMFYEIMEKCSRLISWWSWEREHKIQQNVVHYFNHVVNAGYIMCKHSPLTILTLKLSSCFVHRRGLSRSRRTACLFSRWVKTNRHSRSPDSNTGCCDTDALARPALLQMLASPTTVRRWKVSDTET